MSCLFVTGTDTEIGKTHVATALLHGLRGLGLSAVGYKPVASGCERIDGQLRNVDALALARAGSVEVPYEWTNPYALEPAVAPHLAAEDAGIRIDPEVLIAGAERLQAQADVVVIEGAGGLLVPIDAAGHVTWRDLLTRTRWPSLLVVGMRLGCINHALLTAEAVSAVAPLWGWAANLLPPEQPMWQRNISCLDNTLKAPRLVTAGTGEAPEILGSRLVEQGLGEHMRRGGLWPALA